MTSTSSSRRIFRERVMSKHLRSEGDDAHEVAFAQLAGHGAEDAGPARRALRVDADGGVLVGGDVGAVVAAVGLLGPHDHGRDDLALADRALGRRRLDRGDDCVADAGVAPPGAAADADAEDLARTGVVGHAQPRLVLDHRALSRTSSSRQRLVADSGRDSTTRTTSPSWASLASSWAWSFIDERTIFS